MVIYNLLKDAREKEASRNLLMKKTHKQKREIALPKTLMTQKGPLILYSNTKGALQGRNQKVAIKKKKTFK